MPADGHPVRRSNDNGESWTSWRKIVLPGDVGPASLTNPIVRLPSGRLAISIETNKQYYDMSPWKQRVVYIYSHDDGRSWTAPRTICEDPSGTLFTGINGRQCPLTGYWRRFPGPITSAKIDTSTSSVGSVWTRA